MEPMFVYIYIYIQGLSLPFVKSRLLQYSVIKYFGYGNEKKKKTGHKIAHISIVQCFPFQVSNMPGAYDNLAPNDDIPM